MKNILFTFLFIGAIELPGCKEYAQSNCSEGASFVTLKDYTGFDGCRWLIILADETTLEPTNLSDFEIELKDGKAFCITYEETLNPSICMMGPTIKLLSIH